MRNRPWILLIEPDPVTRKLICDEVRKCVRLRVDLIEAESVEAIGTKIAEMKVLPSILIVEWFSKGQSVEPSLRVLAKHDILGRIFVIAVAGPNGRQALAEAQRLGVRRFVSKLPDEIAFQSKMADVLHECSMSPSLLAA